MSQMMIFCHTSFKRGVLQNTDQKPLLANIAVAVFGRVNIVNQTDCDSFVGSDALYRLLETPSVLSRI